MESKNLDSRAQVRDGVETMPELAEMPPEWTRAKRTTADDLLDEALLESFPASDPMASGRME
ncbi:hypothetical protein EXN24_25205 [Rhizobium rhizogenes]|jgi:hypothetical protein|uniref:Uncharacterized protein n=1 Tax=Rhizobium rhizogenes TaxID=359 RepID=A0AA95AG03_RHIRH|nr:hypothetical protein [Rhizobium rhizogenes]NSY62256.1 hypothetical protein [Agrobacterium tumefaciens]TRA84558.1 hypothetical protein EXN24_25205 [Rhizobium rhizogenes]UXT84465.1 hypothetical protein FY131_23435 [Agrobacterium tumefaciens]